MATQKADYKYFIDNFSSDERQRIYKGQALT
jgi:hypothetical protein